MRKDTFLEEHLTRLFAGIKGQYGITNLADWIQKYTYIEGHLFSFEGREFQLPILKDTAKTSIIVKCAQVGLSEIAYRYAIAACCNLENFTLIYTFPTSGDAEKNCKTRIDPLIDGSPAVQRLVSPDLNSSEVKKFGANSFLFFKGTFSAQQGISTPADAIVHDEWDKSDTTKGSVYVSRLQDKETKIRKIFSTPTVEKFGVSKEAETARRFKHLATCDHCNHVFLPDYFTDIVVPGWDKPMEEITKQNLHLVKWKQAWLKCPKCGLDPNLHHTRMQFVSENLQEQHEANAWYVSPFSAHARLKPHYLVQVSTMYERYSEFRNQTLGLTGEDKNEQIQEADIRRCYVPFDLNSSETHVMGSDLGLICHIVIGRVTSTNETLIVHRERVHYTQFEKRTAELMMLYKVIMHVMDTLPYTELVTRLCAGRHNHWGAIFVNTKSPLPYALQEQEEDKLEGKLNLNLVKINRTVSLDRVRDLFKSGNLKIAQQESEDDDYVTQCTSLKRVEKYTNENELKYVWEKTGTENDHYHFATLYFTIAADMRHTALGLGAASAGVDLVSTVMLPQSKLDPYKFAHQQHYNLMKQ